MLSSLPFRRKPDAPKEVVGEAGLRVRLRELQADAAHVGLLLIHVADVQRLSVIVGRELARALLEQLWERLDEARRIDDELIQLGEGRYAYIVRDLISRQQAMLAAQKQCRIASDVAITGVETPELALHIGVAVSADAVDAQALATQAEIALVVARAEGPVALYDERRANEPRRQWLIERHLRDALKNGDVMMHYMAKIDLDSGHLVGAECLARLPDLDGEPIGPDRFIPVAEASGLILPLSDYVVQHACKQLSRWRGRFDDLELAVNVSAASIADFDIVANLENALGIWSAKPSRLTIEITEDALIADPDMSREVLKAIKALDVGVSIDDFGTGYSSLAYLKNIPADELKIDRSFVSRMLEDSADAAIVWHTISIAESFGLRSVAEGVENADIQRALERLGCNMAQGYHISKPLPLDSFEQFVEAWQGVGKT